jgi:hypothetical protein
MCAMAERDELLQALDACLASLKNGASLDSALAAYPALAADLRPLLVAARSAGAGRDLARVPAGAQTASRSQFLTRAAGRSPALVPAAGRGSWSRSRLRSWLGARSLAGGSLPARAVTVAVVVLAGLGAGGYGAVATSAQSLPGDALYGVKRTVENTELLLAPDEQARSRLQTEFDDRRVREAQAAASQGRKVAVEFTGTLISMEGAQLQHWLVSGILVLVGPQVPVEGEPIVGAQVRIVGLVQTAGQIDAQQVTVLPYHAGAPDATATASGTTPETTATANDAPATASPTATVAAPAATPTSPPPTATRTAVAAATATDDHGGGPGPSPLQTPRATAGGGDHDGNPSETPEATAGGGDHDGGGGPSPSNTPQPTGSGGGGGGPSPSNTPQPDD